MRTPWECILDVPPNSCSHLFFVLHPGSWWGRRRGWGGTQSHVSRELNRVAVPSVSHKVGSGRSHGGCLLGWAKTRGEKAAVESFSYFFSNCVCVCFTLTVSAPRPSLASVMFFFSSEFIFWVLNNFFSDFSATGFLGGWCIPLN